MKRKFNCSIKLISRLHFPLYKGGKNGNRYRVHCPRLAGGKWQDQYPTDQEAENLFPHLAFPISKTYTHKIPVEKNFQTENEM